MFCAVFLNEEKKNWVKKRKNYFLSLLGRFDLASHCCFYYSPPPHFSPFFIFDLVIKGFLGREKGFSLPIEEQLD